MNFKQAISLIILILAFGLSSEANVFEKSKPINYYIEHDGEQKTKPKYTEGSFEKDALLQEAPEEKKSFFGKKKVKKSVNRLNINKAKN